MQYRKLGSTDIELSIIGFGGIVVMNRPQDEADAEVAAAFDAGIRYYDVAPQYGDAQQRLGPALKPYRDQVALACKTLERTAEGAAAELDDSLTKLRTDHFDIYQMHSLSKPGDVDTALGEGGAIETFLKAKEQGKVRYIGFSAHDQDQAMRAIESGHFDTVLYPLNFRTWHEADFGPPVIAAANARGMGIMALKSLARRRWFEDEKRTYAKCWYRPEDRPEIAAKMLSFTLGLPGVAAALPPGNEKLFNMVMDVRDQIGEFDETMGAELAEALNEGEPIFSAEPVG